MHRLHREQQQNSSILRQNKMQLCRREFPVKVMKDVVGFLFQVIILFTTNTTTEIVTCILLVTLVKEIVYHSTQTQFTKEVQIARDMDLQLHYN